MAVKWEESLSISIAVTHMQLANDGRCQSIIGKIWLVIITSLLMNSMNEDWFVWVCFFNNKSDDYTLAYSHKQKNNLPYSTMEQSCLCHSLYWLWREWCFAVLKAGSQWPVSQSSEAGSQNKNKGCLGIDVARPPRALGQGPDGPISRDR